MKLTDEQILINSIQRIEKLAVKISIAPADEIPALKEEKTEEIAAILKVFRARGE